MSQILDFEFPSMTGAVEATEKYRYNLKFS